MNNSKAYLLMILWLLLWPLNLFLEPIFLWVHLLLTVSMIIVVTLTTIRLSFFVFLVMVLTYGFVLTYVAMRNHTLDMTQVHYISAHVTVTAILLVTWLLINEIKQTTREVQELQVKVKELVRYDEKTKALSIQEFKERGSLIETSLKRRGDQGILVHFSMNENIDEKVVDSLHLTFIRHVLKIVRGGYDLVTSKSADHTFLLLQGTSIKGAEIVINRLIQDLHSDINVLEFPYAYQLHEIQNISGQVDSLLDRAEVTK